MATIFKRDKQRKHQTYSIQYFDHEGRRKTVQGFTDKGLTEQLAAKLESDARLRSSGLIDPEQERYALQRQLPLTEVVAVFKEGLSEKSSKYIQHTTSRLQRIIDDCGFTKLGDIEPQAVEKCLRQIRKTDEIGNRTSNHYLQAIDTFCNWCVTTKRLLSNPLAGMERLNAEVDVRHKRRALSGEEFVLLVQSARDSGGTIQGFDGEQRARIYLLSYMTGIRQKELGSLTPRSFALKSDPATVTVEAGTSKHRKKDVLPLHPELVAVLWEWTAGLKPSEKLFPKLERRKAWLMVKKDLERVGLKYETEEGIADFHAAGRHTHITELLRNGATLPEAQKLARHSDIKMTMKYVHIGIDDQAKAVANLPSAALHGRCISGGIDRHSMSTNGKASTKKKRLNPR
ncbi:MAG: tyrosine-type recombinase/integrase, partial [Planctomycetaceae bacterium]|nr:tyrosine-type recombinase/integrase [Planctomycetaceae bacterium]